MNLSGPGLKAFPLCVLRRLCLALLCLGLAAGTAANVWSQSLPVAPEYYFKAAFLTNFARMVDWPETVFASDDQPLVLCVLDARPFGGALEAIEGKIVRGRRMTVRVCDRIQDVEPCHILFANSPDAATRAAFIDAYAQQPVLIVVEESGFALSEGMIGFFSSQNRINFMIDPWKIERVGLKISSRLLKLGRIVHSLNQR